MIIIKSIPGRNLYKVLYPGQKRARWVFSENIRHNDIKTKLTHTQKEPIMAAPVTPLEKESLKKAKAEFFKEVSEENVGGYKASLASYRSKMNEIAALAKTANVQAAVIGITAAEQKELLGDVAVSAISALILGSK